jgi:hypothetical protein
MTEYSNYQYNFEKSSIGDGIIVIDMTVESKNGEIIAEGYSSVKGCMIRNLSSDSSDNRHRERLLSETENYMKKRCNKCYVLAYPDNPNTDSQSSVQEFYSKHEYTHIYRFPYMMASGYMVKYLQPTSYIQQIKDRVFW